MEDYTSEDYKAWKKNFRVNTQTQSNNYRVKSLYEIILKNEMRDTDYRFFVGADEFLNYLDGFSDDDFKALVTDIPNWTDDQHYILNECLTARELCVDQYRKTKAFEYQSDLLPVLFSITNDDQIKNDIFEHVELIIAGKPKSYNLLLEMKLWADKQLFNLQNGFSAYKLAEVHLNLLQQAIQ